MATTAPHSAQNRFSRIGFSLGLRSHPELRGRARDVKKRYHEEDWYIPYTGPYELPPEPPVTRNKDRDSWGDPILGPPNEDSFGDNGLHVRYADNSSDLQGFGSSEDSRARGRERSYSMASNYSESMGVDHTRSSFGAIRHSAVSSSQRPPAPSYASLDTTGGVGESPVPNVGGTGDRPTSHRSSLAHLFGTFGIKSPSSSVFAERSSKNSPGKRPSRFSTTAPGGKSSTNDHRRTTSGDSHSHSIRDRRGITEPLQSLDSQTTTDDDYYNSYYSTLIQTPAKAQSSPADPPSVSTAPPTTRLGSSPFQHPYALAFSKKDDLPTPPSTAPPTTHSQRPPLVAPKLTFSSEVQNTSAQPLPATSNSVYIAQEPLPNSEHHQKIKPSTSTPNLVERIRISTKSAPGTPRNFPKSKEWWLSAETWCDALLFPRPRLKLKGEKGSSGRIVSPPGSPILWSGLGNSGQSDSVASRVLVHSRSLVDLRKEVKGGEDSKQQQEQHSSEVEKSLAPPPRAEAQSSTAGGNGNQLSLKPLRPKSWALDDLALLSPVPSVSKVLEDREKLANERQKWQDKAFGSLGNKHARSVSRARSKSLTAEGRKTSNQIQSNIDFLAARAHLGNQSIIPVLPSPNKLRKTPSRGTVSRGSHSRSNSQRKNSTGSVIQTLGRSSKSHSRTHSRNDSWSKTAFKIAKSTAVACFNGEPTVTPIEEKKPQQINTLEHALQGSDTKVIRLADPALISVERNISVSTRNGVSPTPSGVSSGISDPRVGIALSTPPVDNPYDRDQIRLATHPYAQGGLYSYAGPFPVQEKPAEYAGPHPSATPATTIREADVLPEGSAAARHKLPPHVALHHPYAQALSSPDSYDEKLVKHLRADSNVPPAAKMWVPLSPGVVREILPTDLRYSPYIDGDVKIVNGITDTMGVGEALAYAALHRERESKDSGLGTSENIHGLKDDGDAGQRNESEIATRLDSPSRVPVQYDVTKPTYLLQRAQRSVETAHTYESSPLEYLTPKIPEYVRDHSIFSPPPPIHSEESSQRDSPRPLGSPTDLGGFQDLFYKPGSGATRKDSWEEQSVNGSTTRLSGIPFDLKSPRRPASGLTSLARKLSEEYEQLSILERTSSRYSQSSGGGSFKPSPSLVRRPTEGSLEFVFEEVPNPDSPTQGTYLNDAGKEVNLPFEPEANVPEDVVSGSEAENERHVVEEEEEEEEDVTVLCLKQVEASTPAPVSTTRRPSFTGQMAYVGERHEVNAPQSVTGTTSPSVETETGTESKSEPLSPLSPTSTEARILSGLQAPLTDLTRSSYITTSTMSRMSNLSDFPVPPKDYINNGRMSLLSAYFDEALGRDNGDPIPEVPSQMLVPMREESPVPSSSLKPDPDDQLAFGAGADAREIVEVLLDHHPGRI